MASSIALPQNFSPNLPDASLPTIQTPDPPPQPIPPSPEPPPPSDNPIPSPVPPSPSDETIPDPLPKQKWSTLFTSKPRNAGTYEAENIELKYDGENLIPTEDIIQASMEQWNGFLVGFFLDSPLPYYAVVNYLQNHWRPQGTIDFKSNGSIFFFQFSSLADRIRVLEADPVIIYNKLFIVKPWEPSLSNAANTVKVVPVWIKMYNIPMVALSKRGICWMATRVGKFLCMDANTESLNRLEYAKCMVEVSSNSPLPDSFPVRNLDGSIQIVKVFYLWKPELCHICKVFGHSSEKCQRQSEKVSEKLDNGLSSSGNTLMQQKENIKAKENRSTKTDSNKVARVNRESQRLRNAVTTKVNSWTRVVKKRNPVRLVVSSKEKGKQVMVDVSPPVQVQAAAGTSNRYLPLLVSEVHKSKTAISYEKEDGEIESISTNDKGERGDADVSKSSETVIRYPLRQIEQQQTMLDTDTEKNNKTRQIAIVDDILYKAFGSPTENLCTRVQKLENNNENPVAASDDGEKVSNVDGGLKTGKAAVLCCMESTTQIAKSKDESLQQNVKVPSAIETARSTHIKTINADIMYITNNLQSQLANSEDNSPEYHVAEKKLENFNAFCSGIVFDQMHTAQLDSVSTVLQRSIASAQKKMRKTTTVTDKTANPYAHLAPPPAYKARPPDIVTDQVTSSSNGKTGPKTHVTRSVKKEMLNNLQENG